MMGWKRILVPISGIYICASHHAAVCALGLAFGHAAVVINVNAHCLSEYNQLTAYGMLLCLGRYHRWVGTHLK